MTEPQHHLGCPWAVKEPSGFMSVRSIMDPVTSENPKNSYRWPHEFWVSSPYRKKKIISLISKYSLQDAVKLLPFFFSDTGLLLTTARRNKIRKEFIKKTYRQASTYLAKTFLLSQVYGQEFNRCFPLSVLNCVLLHITLRYSPLLHLLSLYVHWTSILHCFFLT